MFLATAIQYYKQQRVREALVSYARHREIAVRFDSYFGKRPDVLEYPGDVLELAKKKAYSFHCSEELWSNPLSLRTGITAKEMDELRIGWDLILDIDCDHYPYSRLAADLLVGILQELGVTAVTAKFSGNSGFHVAVPFQAFPKRITTAEGELLTANAFPEAPRRIAAYLSHRLQPVLSREILKYEEHDLQRIMDHTSLESSDLIAEDKDYELNVETFLEIDTVLIAPRHLFRMPYSLHEKSGLVSQPVRLDEIRGFEREDAEPSKVEFDVPFLTRQDVENQAEELVREAYDFKPKKRQKKRRKVDYKPPAKAIPEDYFPPCIHNIFEGMEDGRKRAVFTLVNFLKGAGWGKDEIEERLEEWNKQNPEKLREVYLKGQLRQGLKTQEIIPPHNCPHAGKSYYDDLGVCEPDSFCKKIKNPLQYARRKHKRFS